MPSVDDGSSNLILDQARARGRRVGMDRDATACDCPYGHAATGLRMAWMDGFSEGRGLLQDPDGLMKRMPLITSPEDPA